MNTNIKLYMLNNELESAASISLYILLVIVIGRVGSGNTLGSAITSSIILQQRCDSIISRIKKESNHAIYLQLAINTGHDMSGKK